MNDFSDFLSIVEDSEFEENPAPLDEFLYSDEFLGLPALSDYQFKIVEAMTQIYRYETLRKLWGEEEADRLWESTHKEIILYLGKGSGKDYLTAIAFARIIYLLLCLKEPARYYGKPRGDSIALLNVAINAKQAKEVFFRGNLKQRVENCPWFNGKYEKPTADEIRFDKSITAYSGHSERESWEGYNLIIVCLDEIAGFDSEDETAGPAKDKTADALYDMYSASVISRFPDIGKLVLLSFSRYKNDFIDKRYNKVVAEKNTVIKEYTFQIHPDMGNTEENTFTVSWEEDHIISYAEPDVYALRRPVWYINPTKKIEDYKMRFYHKMADSLTRFACMPGETIDAFFKDKEKIERTFPEGRPGPFHDDWSFRPDFNPKLDKKYYLHVDLGYTHDRAAVAMAHVENWKEINYGGDWTNVSPIVVIDAVRYWTPNNDGIQLEDIEDYILSLVRRGFKIKLVTYDKWNSLAHRQKLENNYKINTDLLSVAKPHYEELKTAMAYETIEGYELPVAVDELKALRVIKGNKVDHPRKGSKDVSDAIAGAVYNAIANETRPQDEEIEVYYLTQLREDDTVVPEPEPEPPPKMPREIEEYLESLEVL